MSVDVLQLNEFYASAKGELTQHAVLAALKQMWHPLAQERLIGLGYTMPYLDAFEPDTERTCSFMPAKLGALPWPAMGKCKTALVDEEEMPLADASVDRVLVVHGFEHCDNYNNVLQEIWRVLTPNGRLVMVVPNRRGIWVGMEKNPFGWGQPWSKSQLENELNKNLFTPLSWSSALHFPPLANKMILKFSKNIERFGNRFLSALGGVLIVEAQKELYQGVKVEETQKSRVFIPALAPQNVSSNVALRHKNNVKKINE